MTTLDFEGQPPVVTDDAERIATLARKGWTVRPDMPIFNAETHTCNWSVTEWVLAAITPAVPQEVSRRQAKTIMELSPHPVHGDLWQAALMAASAITDRPTRITTTNFLMESQVFEYPRVLAMASQLLGMTSAQVDQLFIEASKL